MTRLHRGMNGHRAKHDRSLRHIVQYHSLMSVADPQALQSYIQNNLGTLISRMRTLVLQESPSEDPAAVNAAMALAESFAKEIGGRAKYHKQKAYGHVLELQFGPRKSAHKPILLLGHLDTVWPYGTLAKMPWKHSTTKIEGPGTLDMKAGVAMAFSAIEALNSLSPSGKLARPITLLLNSEEEIGSPVSRPITETLALNSSAVLVLEPAQGLALKTARKGVGHYVVEVAGVAAHSGVDFQNGHSAILELARQVERISAFTDLERGLTVNCGVISGGTRSNVVAARAQVEVDVRIARASDAKYVEKLFRTLKPIDSACTITVSGGLNRPPMERNPGTLALIKQAKKLAAQLGFALDEAATGGGSDGNFTAALGVPTLDGMGAIGTGAHAPHEHILTEHLVPRTALLAAMLATHP